jgi:hypothetical protein
MKSDDEIIDSLISGGIIGAALGALISKSKNGPILGALAGAVILATYKANEKAKATKIPLFVEEAGSLYEIKPDGSKRFVKKITKPVKKLQQNFKLK